MNHRDFENLLESIRTEVPDGKDAAERVRARLETAAREGPCGAFRSDLAALRAGTLPPARRLLVHDHLHSCVACRRAYSGSGERVLAMPRRSPVRWPAWVAAAAAAAVMLYALPPVLERGLAPAGMRGTVVSIDGSLAAVLSDGAALLSVGAELAEGQTVRTGPASRAVVRLRDGSLVEMAERSVLAIHEGWRNKTVRLERGNVIVEAAKQRSGRLEVATADALVRVKGTIFGVSAGWAGSRVSVIEGVVEVQEAGASTVTLTRGDQKATGTSPQAAAVADDVSWSANAARYAALLADLRDVHEQIARIPMPGLRYSTRLLDRVPPSSAAVAAMPNLRQVLSEANRIFEDKARQSSVMAEWWNNSGAVEMRQAVDRALAIGAFLGDEIVVAMPRQGTPVLLAELRPEVRREEFSAELTRAGFPGAMAFEGNLVAVGSAAVPPPAGFLASPLGARMLENYRAGAGLLFAMNVEQMRFGSVSPPVGAAVTGLDNVRFVVAEQKGPLAAPVHTADLAFDGPRHGLASWLAAPAPMGSLEFVSAGASFAASFVTRDPREMLNELSAVGFLPAGLADVFRRESGVDLIEDLAGSLGGEVMVALDGGLLPTPAWKVAVEVERAELLQQALDRAAEAAGVALSRETVDGRVFYTLASGAMPVHYTFADGYWLLGANRALLLTAIANRAAALTLPRSAAFRAQLPADGPSFFSGLFYYNLGVTIGPVVDQLKATGMLAPDQQEPLQVFTANRAPGLVYVYASPDNLRAGSQSPLFPIGLQALISGNPMAGLPVGFPKGPQ